MFWYLIALIILMILIFVRIENYFGKADDGATHFGCEAMEDPNGEEFDWSAVHTNEMLERCLLDLASNIGSIEGMTGWLSEQGFNVSVNQAGVSDRNVLWAEWIPEGSRSMPFDPNWSFLRRWYFSRFPYAISIAYENGVPFRVIAVHQTK